MLISYKNANIYQRHGICVLSDVNFQVEEGQFVYIIGRVGTGKTSLLRTLYFELDIDEANEAKVFDYDLLNLRQKDIPSLRRQMGVIFQDFHLLSDRTVYKNLQFVLKATGWKKKEEIDQRIDEVLSAVDMQDKTDKMPFELSGGEQQRICIARAFLNNPKMILADEPTGNLDPESGELILAQLDEIRRQNQTAILVSTHNLQWPEYFPGSIYRCTEGIFTKER